MLKKVVTLNLPKSVAVFGSARLPDDHKHCQAAEYIGRELGSRYVSVMTGGGPSIMKMALKGCKESGKGAAVGIRINLPNSMENDPSVEVYHDITIRKHSFEFRQTSLIDNASAIVAMQGGVGTEFEVMNVITLMQCGFRPRRPVYLYDSKVWKSFDKRMQDFVKMGTISKEDLDLYIITDDLDEIVQGVYRQVEDL